MTIKRLFILTILCLNLNLLSKAQQAVFQDASKPIDTRIKDLVSKMTLSEKISQLMNSSPSIPRLQVPEYNWWNEALHGVGRSGVATVFPQAIGLGATFDEALALKVSSAISDEARATYNISVSEGKRMQFSGLTFWTPNINIFRDPRWGRGQETYGEDPTLTARLGVAFVKGLQGNHPKYLKTAACAKHFAVHSGPEKLRHEFNAEVSDKDLRETYLPAFKALVDANVESVMCAYNRTNGAPCCANNYLIQNVLRKEWGFKGHVVTDCDAVTDIYKGHKFTADAASASAASIKAGICLECGEEFNALNEAVKLGMLKESEIDSALSTLLRTRFKLGMFDEKGLNPYDALDAKTINSQEHRKLAMEVAEKSMVLLKNNGVLPLKSDLPRYYVTGPNATSLEVLMGNYYGVNNSMVTFLEGIVAGVAPSSQVQYKPGCLLDRENINPIDWTTGETKLYDATIAVLGISGYIEGEEGESLASPHLGDRLDYNIPANQINFLKKLRKRNPRPIIAVITGGSPMNLAEIHELADAVILAWYPGEEGGTALANLIFGKKSPSGKLPITFPKSIDQLPAYENYSMEGRTYRYMASEPLYPFGYGLSYTRFEYSEMKASTINVNLKKKQNVDLEVKLSNTGKFDAEEVVQMYISNLTTKAKVPIASLKEFKRVSLKAGESTILKFTITPEMMSYINDKGQPTLEAGDIRVSIGGSSPNKRSTELGLSKNQEMLLHLK